MPNEDIIEQQKIEQQQKKEVAPEDKTLLDAYNELKENTVSKKEYDRVLKRNEELTQALINNDRLEEDNKPKESNLDKIKRLTNELYSDKRTDMTNLEYCQKTVELRDSIIAEGGRDPFLPTSGENKDSYANQQTAEKVANGLRKMVEDANGSPEAFNSLYQARVEDVAVPKRNNYIRR